MSYVLMGNGDINLYKLCRECSASRPERQRNFLVYEALGGFRGPKSWF